MNKAERDELRRLIRAQIKVLRADIDARKAELEVELGTQIDAKYAAMDRAYDDALYRLSLLTDELNRKANDIARELHGTDQWGTKFDQQIVRTSTIPRPGLDERRRDMHRGHAEIEAKVARAKRELDRREAELLTELAVSGLESADAKAFFARIPSVTELVPSYRLPELTD